jgi:DNA-directed RNA polymerase subunit RPC12/RpoP
MNNEQMTLNSPINTKGLQCLDCARTPSDDGPAYIAALLIRQEHLEIGALCDYCVLHRLMKRMPEIFKGFQS